MLAKAPPDKTGSQGRDAKINREAVLKLLQCNPNQYPQMLEDKFPHILNKIITLWSSPDGAAYLTNLLQRNGRSGGRMDRDGLPEKVWQEIFQLKQLYEKPRPKAAR